ncbi:uncharacterized protein V1510DRAFT_422351 [Dipodascopsis tothii]|uniref:uncharacterized protein n=1 Tax=Dipodascopsis tothii TaxID=44089 RepID=UPI0034CF98D5
MSGPGVLAPFAGDEALQARIRAYIESHPEAAGLIRDIASYIDSLGSPPAKRKKTEAADELVKVEYEPSLPAMPAVTIRDVSFTMPLRKKYTIIISNRSLQVVQPTDHSKVELDIPLRSVAFAACLGVPERATPLWNFVVFRSNSDLYGAANKDAATEPLVFSVPETFAKTASGPLFDAMETQIKLEIEARPDVKPENSDSSSDISDEDDEDVLTYKRLLLRAFANAGVEVALPDPEVFHASKTSRHSKTEPEYHVSCHRGSKEGVLYFFNSGVFFGFKKPLLFFPIDKIEAITYSSITRVTFNLTVAVLVSRPGSSDEHEEEFEFSMIDQSEFGTIDSYVRMFKLSDRSMAEERRAKKELKQDRDDTAVNNGDSELAKASRELAALGDSDEDPEDESDDENFEDEDSDDGGSPSGSEDDSDDSGSGEEAEEASDDED